MIKGNKCDNCGKGIMYGHNVSHAKNRTRRIFKPNLHKTRILRGTGAAQTPSRDSVQRRALPGGNYVTMKLCTKCLRLLKAGVKRTRNQKAEPSVKIQPQAVTV